MRGIEIICGGCRKVFRVESSCDLPPRHGCSYPDAPWDEEEERALAEMPDATFVERLAAAKVQLIVPGFYDVSRAARDRLLALARKGSR